MGQGRFVVNFVKPLQFAPVILSRSRWRPVQAIHERGGLYRIVSTNPGPDDERWLFLPGDLVGCDRRTFPAAKVVWWLELKAETLPNNGMQRTRTQRVFYHRYSVRAADAWRYASTS